MLSRRDILQAGAAAAVLLGGNALGRAAAAQAISQSDLLRFEPVGQVTLLHFTDIHAQLMPLHFREPSVNIGVGEALGLPPHLVGTHLMRHFGVKAGTPEAHALTFNDFAQLAKEYGRLGGLAHMATLVEAIRAERPNNTLLLDGGDTWQGSYTSMVTKGADMVKAMQMLGVEAMTAHWEFTYGAEHVKTQAEEMKIPFLCGNVKDTGFGDAVFESTKMFERGGVKIAVIGQAFPYTPIANPRYLIPEWSFGIDEEKVQEHVDAARNAGADLIVLLSHNGFDVDRKMAGRVKGIDVILTGHTHDAIPAVLKVGNTLLAAPGSHGKFLARLDLDVKNKRVADYRFRLIPVFSDAIAPDPAMTKLIEEIRAPYKAVLDKVHGRADSLLYRRGNFNGTFDDLICQAIIAERDAEIALSPGFRWGATLLPGQEITGDALYSQTAITYPNVYRNQMTGEFLKTVLEDVADNLFNPDPYYQQGGDMVRVGGMAYSIDIGKPIGQRISNMTLLRNGEAIQPGKSYTVAGWASVNEGTEGPPIYDLVAKHLATRKTIAIPENRSVSVRGADPRGIAG
jgi:S-sulfosulfanyl-L-cysteine sulfohydrolase